MAPPPSPRPSFIATLLESGPHSALTPSHVMAHGGYEKTLASQIADARMDPRIEAAAHLANGDLYSAHFLVRKMQNDSYGQWLHAILHRFESDYSNTKAWLRDCDEEVLAGFPGFAKGSSGTECSQPAHHAAYLLTDKVALLCKSHSIANLTGQYAEREIPSPPAPTAEELRAFLAAHHKAGHRTDGTPSAEGETWDAVVGSRGLHDEAIATVERESWDELVYLVEMLGQKFGWTWNVEGTQAYTAQTEKQKEMIRRMQGGGEGIRKF